MLSRIPVLTWAGRRSGGRVRGEGQTHSFFWTPLAQWPQENGHWLISGEGAVLARG